MATRPLPIRTDVSPALRPEILDARAPALTGRSQAAFRAAQDALWHLYNNQSLTQIAKQEAMQAQRTPANLRDLQLIREGKMKPGNNVVMKGANIELALPPAVAKQLNEAIELGFGRTMTIMDRASKTIVTELETLHAERAVKTTDPAAKTPAGIAAAAEIRAHLKSLPAAERVALVREQISAGNARVAAAVAESEPFLSGFDPKTHANLVAQTHKQFASEETTKIENLAAVLKTVSEAGSLVVAGLRESFVPVIGQDAKASSALSNLKTGGSES